MALGPLQPVRATVEPGAEQHRLPGPGEGGPGQEVVEDPGAQPEVAAEPPPERVALAAGDLLGAQRPALGGGGGADEVLGVGIVGEGVGAVGLDRPGRRHHQGGPPDPVPHPGHGCRSVARAGWVHTPGSVRGSSRAP